MLDIKIQESSYSLKENLPAGSDRKTMYYITEEHLLKNGLSSKTVHYLFHTGDPKPSLHFVWKIPESRTESEPIKKTQILTGTLKKMFPFMNAG